MLLGQASNKVAYFRRLNILNVSLNSKSDAKCILNTYVPLLSTYSTELFGRQFRKQTLDNAKAQKETLQIFREVGKTKKKPFSAGFPTRNKKSPRVSAGNHNRIRLRQHFRTKQQQRWQKNITSQTTNESNGKTPKANRNYLVQHFSRTSSTRKIRTRSSFSSSFKTKCSSRGKDFPFRTILGTAHKRSGNFRNSEGVKIPLLRRPVQEKIPLNTPLKENQKFLVEKEMKEMLEKGAIKSRNTKINMLKISF